MTSKYRRRRRRRNKKRELITTRCSFRVSLKVRSIVRFIYEINNKETIQKKKKRFNCDRYILTCKCFDYLKHIWVKNCLQ